MTTVWAQEGFTILSATVEPMGFTVTMLVGSGSAIAEGGGADGGGTGGGGAGSGNGCTLSSIVCHQKLTGKHHLERWQRSGNTQFLVR